MAKYFDCHVKEMSLKNDGLILIKVDMVARQNPFGKLAHNRGMPFVIKDQVNLDVYKLQSYEE